jgi:polyisoprenoid-binding protein YceI
MKYISLLLCFFSLCGHAAEWQSDSAKSELAYSVDFEQLPLNGVFKTFSVSYQAAEKLHVVVDIASVDMGNSDINEAIRDADWFDLKRYSQAIYTSTNISATGDNSFIAQGTLQLKGVSKPVSVPFSWQPSETSNSASMHGQLSLSRSDFGIGSPEWASGDQIGIPVTLSFSLQMLSNARD